MDAKFLALCFSLCVLGVVSSVARQEQKPAAPVAAHQQGQAAPAPAPAKDAAAPVLTAEERDAIHEQQVKFLSAQLLMDKYEQQYKDAMAQRNQASGALQQAMGAAQKRIGGGWEIDVDTLTVKAAPKKDEPKKP